jgi:hypothetical protein
MPSQELPRSPSAVEMSVASMESVGSDVFGTRAKILQSSASLHEVEWLRDCARRALTVRAHAQLYQAKRSRCMSRDTCSVRLVLRVVFAIFVAGLSYELRRPPQSDGNKATGGGVWVARHRRARPARTRAPRPRTDDHQLTPTRRCLRGDDRVRVTSQWCSCSRTSSTRMCVGVGAARGVPTATARRLAHVRPRIHARAGRRVASSGRATTLTGRASKAATGPPRAPCLRCSAARTAGPACSGARAQVAN